MKRTKQAKPKKTVTVTIERKILGKAPEKYTFNLTDGRKIQSILELVDELETMTEDAFKHYVTETENHFANWIEHVFDEKHLAEDLRKVHNKLDAQRTVLKHLVKTLLEAKKK